MRRILLAFVSVVAVAGCSDPKKASNANFEKAIQASLDKRPACLDLPSLGVRPAGETTRKAFPMYLALPSNPNGQSVFDSDAKYPEALVSAGLLKSRSGQIAYETFMSSKSEPLPVRIYELTDAGTAALPKPVVGEEASVSSRASFCYGTPEVTEVTQYTEPSPAMGVTMSQVSYTYQLKDRAAWAANPAVAEAFPVVKRDAGDKLEGKTAVLLTNNGWVDARESR